MTVPNDFDFTGTAATAPVELPGHAINTVVEEGARVFGWLEGTATGGSTSTIVDSSLVRYADDYWINAYAYIHVSTDAAAPQGEERFVTDFVSSTGTLTVSPVYTAAAGAGDTYQLFRHVARADLYRATMRAIAGIEAATTLIPRDDTLDYVLNCTGLYRRQQLIDVFVRQHNDVLTMPIRVQGWWLEDAEGILTLRMPYPLNTDDGFWIIYHMGEGEDESTWHTLGENYNVNAPLPLLRARIAVYCIENLLASQDQSGVDRWGRQLQYWTDALLKEERKWQRPLQSMRRRAWERYHTSDTGINSAADTALNIEARYR